MFRTIAAMAFLTAPSALAQTMTCTWHNGGGSCQHTPVKALFAGLGEGYAVRFDKITFGFTGGVSTAQCYLGPFSDVAQVEWATSDLWYREKFALLTSASLAGRKIWLEFVPKTPGTPSSQCVMRYVGI